jgi:hypothetical protein
LTECVADPAGAACGAFFRNLHNPFYIGDDVGLTQTLGWTDAWTSSPSVWAVAARSSADVAAAVDFARRHRLRLVVKGGGHSFLGTSNAPDSLLIWTRPMNAIQLHDAFVARGCGGRIAPRHAVSVCAGAMWIQAYDAVTTRGGRYVQGGGCTTVGVAGLVQGGGFGSFSKGYGTAAASLLEAEVVTADGAVRIANPCANPDLFWAIKGGGGGTFGVITRLTLLAAPASSPKVITSRPIGGQPTGDRMPRAWKSSRNATTPADSSSSTTASAASTGARTASRGWPEGKPCPEAICLWPGKAQGSGLSREEAAPAGGADRSGHELAGVRRLPVRAELASRIPLGRRLVVDLVRRKFGGRSVGARRRQAHADCSSRPNDSQARDQATAVCLDFMFIGGRLTHRSCSGRRRRDKKSPGLSINCDGTNFVVRSPMNGTVWLPIRLCQHPWRWFIGDNTNKQKQAGLILALV